MNVKNVLSAAAFSDEKMRKVNLFETARFFCDVYCLRPGQAQKVHTHATNDKIYYIVKGRAKVIVGKESTVLEAGEIVLAAAGEAHGIENPGDEDVISLVFMAPRPSLE